MPCFEKIMGKGKFVFCRKNTCFFLFYIYIIHTEVWILYFTTMKKWSFYYEKDESNVRF